MTSGATQEWERNENWVHNQHSQHKETKHKSTEHQLSLRNAWKSE